MVKVVDRYRVIRTIGEGRSSKVKYAIDTSSNQPVAIKVVSREKLSEPKVEAYLRREIRIMRYFNSPHFVHLIEVLATKSNIYIVQDLCTGGELFDRIVAEEKFDEPTARSYFRQLLEGVYFCHLHGIAHRDLKPENLLLDEDGILKVTDFGFSGILSSEFNAMNTVAGTIHYSAPEVLSAKVSGSYDGRIADIWSCGVILFVMLAGYLPFEEADTGNAGTSALIKRICERRVRRFPNWLSSEARDLIERMFEVDPSKRIKIPEVFAHPWISADGRKNPEQDLLAQIAKEPRHVTQETLDAPMSFDTGAGLDESGEGSPKGMSPFHKARHKLFRIGQSNADFASTAQTARKSKSTKELQEPAQRVLLPDLPPVTKKSNPRSSLHDFEAASEASADSGGAPATLPPMNAFELVNLLTSANLSSMVLRGSDTVKRLTCFISSRPALELFTRLDSAMSKYSIPHKINRKRYGFKVSEYRVSSVPMTFTIQIYQIIKGLHMVEFNRRMGNVLEFHKTYKTLKDALGDCTGPAEAKNLARSLSRKNSATRGSDSSEHGTWGQREVFSNEKQDILESKGRIDSDTSVEPVVHGISASLHSNSLKFSSDEKHGITHVTDHAILAATDSPSNPSQLYSATDGTSTPYSSGIETVEDPRKLRRIRSDSESDPFVLGTVMRELDIHDTGTESKKKAPDFIVSKPKEEKKANIDTINVSVAAVENVAENRVNGLSGLCVQFVEPEKGEDTVSGDIWGIIREVNSPLRASHPVEDHFPTTLGLERRERHVSSDSVGPPRARILSIVRNSAISSSSDVDMNCDVQDQYF